MSAPKFKIWLTPQNTWRISENMGVDALDASILWMKAAEVDFSSRLAAEEALDRIINKKQFLYDAEGHPL